ncbi:hypothetical protein MWH25_08160 [Natroniella acetigena]|uniref:hypothetical protein n=1 Tax=Natroniella acetigena TaxID=52004 RepID=UPI00200B2178|nr:hypothetical protein [Natroniella acetigena]MCK8827716.1 hypothetical protein [Natroniella acetigena]
MKSVRRWYDGVLNQKFCPERGKFCVGQEPDDLECSYVQSYFDKIVSGLRGLVSLF